MPVKEVRENSLAKRVRGFQEAEKIIKAAKGYLRRLNDGREADDALPDFIEVLESLGSEMLKARVCGWLLCRLLSAKSGQCDCDELTVLRASLDDLGFSLTHFEDAPVQLHPAILEAADGLLTKLEQNRVRIRKERSRRILSDACDLLLALPKIGTFALRKKR